MHGGGTAGRAKKARIEIIPLIDVIMFLLATFVLFTLSMNKSEGQPVNLPTAGSAVPREVTTNTVTITVDPDGKLFWGKDQVSWDDFIIRIVNYKRSTDEPKVYINFDTAASFGQAASVLDEIRKAEIKYVSFETKVKPPGT
jgi:biopolymer transport protein ExbD